MKRINKADRVEKSLKNMRHISVLDSLNVSIQDNKERMKRSSQ